MSCHPPPTMHGNEPSHIPRSPARGKRFLGLFCAFFLSLGNSAEAAGLIRDAEIETTLRRFGTPLWQQAGLNPDAVRIFVVNDPAINAFVAGGANIFINTGLILNTKNADMLIGVMAHETGHIAGGHLIRGKSVAIGSNIGLLIATALGAGAAIAGGGAVGMGALLAGQQAVTRNFLAFSRTQEASADQAALRFLDGAGISAQGMLSMFEVLRQKEVRQFGTIDPYNLTHPMSQDRITTLRSHVMQSTTTPDAVPPGFDAMHARLVAKLYGFLDAPEYTLAKYPSSDQSLPGYIARAVADWRGGRLAQGLKEIDAAMLLAPQDGFLYDLKAQILLDSARVAEAVALYREAIRLEPKAPVMHTDFGRALLALGTPAGNAEAVQVLERGNVIDPDNAGTWDLLAIAYGKQGRTDRSLLAQAEAASLRNEPEQALSFLRAAENLLKPDTPAYLRAQDLRRLAEEQKKAREKEGTDGKERRDDMLTEG